MFGLKRLFRQEKGNALVLAGLAMPVLIGFVGLATDTIQWTLDKRELQRLADSAAMAGAYAIAQEENGPQSARDSLDANNHLTLAAQPDIDNAPTSGGYAGNSNAISVALSMRRNLPFSSLFLNSAPLITARSTAAVISNGNYCVISLEDSTNVGISVTGSSNIDLNCGMFTNSRAANAVYANGSAILRTTIVGAVGGITPNPVFQNATLLPYAVAQPDPFAYLENPTVSNCTSQLRVGSNTTRTVTPGCYRSIDIQGTATFEPGVYYVDGGDIDFGAQAHVMGTGVTFIMTSSTASTSPSTIGDVDINGGAEMQLYAPTEGTFAGVLFYQDRRKPLGDTSKINGNSASVLQGAFYFPSSLIEFSGTSGMQTDCIQLIGRRARFIGNTTISNVCPLNATETFRGSVVRLVE